jgi:hypothetical protein
MELTKKIIGATLFVSLAFKMLMAPIFFVNYELRKDYIIKNYCVNKNRPEMHCDGKCYLAKQIQKAEQEDEKQATNNFISKLLSLEVVQKNPLFSNYFPAKSFREKSIQNFQYKNRISYLHAFSFFHPPQV